jgi:hypothetical protein
MMAMVSAMFLHLELGALIPIRLLFGFDLNQIEPFHLLLNVAGNGTLI